MEKNKETISEEITTTETTTKEVATSEVKKDNIDLISEQLTQLQSSPNKGVSKREELINTAMQGMEEVQYMMAEITEFSAQISDRFDGISQTVKEIGDGAISFMQNNRRSLFKNKDNADLAMGIATVATTVVSGAVSFFGGLIADYKKNKQLNKLLVVKQEIATDKIDVVRRSTVLMEQNINIFNQVINEYVAAEYSLEELRDYDLRGKHLEAMAQAMEQFKKACFLYFISNFVLSEYEAWLEGKHESGSSYPNEDSVNGFILYNILYPPIKSYRKSENKDSTTLILKDMTQNFSTQVRDTVPGSFLYLISDEQLLSKFFLDNSINDLFRIHSFIMSNQALASILRENRAYVNNKFTYDSMNEIEEGDNGTFIYYTLKTTFIASSCYYVYLEYATSGWWLIPCVFLFYWFLLNKPLKYWYKKHNIKIAEELKNQRKSLIRKLRAILMRDE